jgi:hypothetical protein
MNSCPGWAFRWLLQTWVDPWKTWGVVSVQWFGLGCLSGNKQSVWCGPGPDHYLRCWSDPIDRHFCCNNNRRLQFILCQPWKTTFQFPFPCAANKWKFVVSVFRLRYSGNREIWRHGNIRQKTEVQAIFLIPFTVCLSCKRKFVVSLFADEEKNRSSVCKWTCPSICDPYLLYVVFSTYQIYSQHFF